jgi:hypothetical protein
MNDYLLIFAAFGFLIVVAILVRYVFKKDVD